MNNPSDSHPTRHILAGLATETIQDFYSSMGQDLDRAEQQLMDIHLADYAGERLLYTLEMLNDMDSNCRTVFMDTLLQYVDSVRDIVEAAIEERIPTNEMFSELMLIMLDVLRMSSKEVFIDGVVNTDMLEELIDENETLANLPAEEIQDEMAKIVGKCTEACCYRRFSTM